MALQVKCGNQYIWDYDWKYGKQFIIYKTNGPNKLVTRDYRAVGFCCNNETLGRGKGHRTTRVKCENVLVSCARLPININ